MKPVHGTSDLICISCNNIEKGEISSTTKIKIKPEKGKGVIEDKDIFADYDFLCSKCGHNKAQAIIRAPHVSDEDDPVYFRCGKCGHTKQVAKKVT